MVYSQISDDFFGTGSELVFRDYHSLRTSKKKLQNEK